MTTVSTKSGRIIKKLYPEKKRKVHWQNQILKWTKERLKLLRQR